ncbi:MAG: PAS domain S-box protein [Candidatus Riflebacteria bacterium]|nr:PAS domain S-box protein [Candidatus Riflebacteria bacterium]
MIPDRLQMFLRNDLLSNILKYSEDIGKCGFQLTMQIREIIGSRLVALFERNFDGKYSIIGICPERRIDFFENPQIKLLIDSFDFYTKSEIINSDNRDYGKILNDLGIKNSFFIPIRSGNLNQGMLLLIDIMDSRGINAVFEALADISQVLSLILKNSFLFRNLEKIAEQKTQALRESELKSRVILEVAMDGFLIADQTGKILESNQALLNMTGYSSNELIGLNFSQIDVESPSQTFSNRINQAITGNNTRYESKLRRKDGKELFVDISIQKKPGNSSDIFAFIHDLSKRKLLEKEQEELLENLAQSQKMESIGRLAGGVAHDFNNMLGVIFGNIDLILSQLSSKDQMHEKILQIQKAARNSAALTRQLLTFARKQPMEPVVLNINETIKNMLSLLTRLIGENIELVWMPAKELKLIKMDPVQLDQILTNLCINARDAISGIGKIQIETGNVTFCKKLSSFSNDVYDGDYVYFSVTDNGSGMEKDTISHIFEPFFTTKEAGKGTGLGMPTVYGITKQNGGLIDINSKLGVGSEFKIFFPTVSDKFTHSAEPIKPKMLEPSTGTILLVEDEISLLQLTETLLKRLGYKVFATHSPFEALKIAEAQSGKIDILLSDVVMPEMNGYRLSEKLKELYPNLKILLMSGYSNGNLPGNINAKLLPKPFKLSDLSLNIQNLLKEK